MWTIRYSQSAYQATIFSLSTCKQLDTLHSCQI
jgi:hypothetical protein